jgi:hypothetical protein
VENGKLYYVRSPSNRSELVSDGNDSFTMKENGTIVIFIRDEKNKVTSIKISIGGGKPIFLNGYTPIKYEKSTLSEIPGNYYSEELDVTWKVDVGDSKLLITALNSQISFSFSIITQDSFADASKGVSIEITRDKNKKVNGFSFTEGRVRKIHFTRK